MLPACRTGGEGFAIPTFDLVPSDVEGFMEELWAFQSAFHDCFARSEPRAHFFDYMVGQFSALERKSIEPMALQVEGGLLVKRGHLTQPSCDVSRTFGVSRPGSLPIAEVPRCPQPQSWALGMCQLLLPS